MIYLDNSATTPIKPEVYDAMIPYLTNQYGNPSSKYYPLAVDAKKAVELARSQVAKLIGANPDEIIFTSGATESTNMIIKGVADYKKYYEKKGNHIITSSVEHKATLNTCKFLNGEIYSNNDASFSFGKSESKVDRGYEVSFLDVNEYGQVIPKVLDEAINDKTIIASIIWGNNEIASLNDVKALSNVCHSKGVLFHTDATQVLGKLPIDVRDINVDFMSLSAHKVYGPKGIGASYVKSDDYGMPPFSSLIHGGEQEDGVRGSTLPVHNIVGFGKACEIALREQNEIFKKYQEIDEIIIKELSNIPDIHLLGDLENRLPGIYSITINRKDFNNERFLQKVSNEYALSTGSACTAGKPSYVLQAIGFGDLTSNVIRISINADTDVSQITNLINNWILK